MFKYAGYMMDEREFKYAEAQFSRNQNQLSYVQEQIDPKQFMADNGILDEFDEW